ncbi:caspase family protein [Streptomyces sp. NPDC002185]|uniref:caspase, EACC1-associated type n=1 Tax=Streptomyces sp. NPDC002185 TaxID=3364636 RepID=UPI0036948D8A
MPVADPGASRAVLVGIGTYTSPDLEQLPAAEEGAIRLGSLLCDTAVWGLADTSVTVLDSKSSETAVLKSVRDAAADATDALVVYFAGHGLLDRAGKLHLAFPMADADHPQIGTIPYVTIREVVQQAGRHLRSWVIILDCCYSGAAGMGTIGTPTRAELATAIEESASSDPARATEEDETESDDDYDYGSCVLTSTSAVQRSFVAEGANYPEFTAELIDILHRGISGRGATLSLADTWQTIKKRMRMRGSPEPHLFPHNGVDHRFQWHNRAHNMPQRKSEPIVVAPRQRPAPPLEEPNTRARRILTDFPADVVTRGQAIKPRVAAKARALFHIPESESLIAVGRAEAHGQFSVGKRLLVFTETMFYASDGSAMFGCPYAELSAVQIAVRSTYNAGFPEWYVDLTFRGNKVGYGPWGEKRAELVRFVLSRLTTELD